MNIFGHTARAIRTKIILTVQKDIAERAKTYAKSTGRSLSKLIESYLEHLTQEDFEKDLSPKLNKIVGSVQLPAEFDEDKDLRFEIEKKFGL